MKITLGFLLILIIGCTGNRINADNQTLNFGSFSIVTPNSWTKIKTQGIDSYVGQIAIDKTDTLEFDLGWYSNTLTEPEPQIIERWMLKDMNVLDTTQFVIVDNLKGIDPDKYKKKCFVGYNRWAKSKNCFPEAIRYWHDGNLH